MISGAPWAAADRCGRRHVIDDESGVRRRVEVRRQQIDVALRTLRPFEEPGGQANPLDQDPVSDKRRPWVHHRRRHEFGDAAGATRRVQADAVRYAAAKWTRRIGDLRLQQAAHRRIAPRDGRVDRRGRGLRGARQDRPQRTGGTDRLESITTSASRHRLKRVPATTRIARPRGSTEPAGRCGARGRAGRGHEERSAVAVHGPSGLRRRWTRCRILHDCLQWWPGMVAILVQRSRTWPCVWRALPNLARPG